ncbi:hypothetical protein XENOCAPTIV_028114 [Xenoophorus captivus]|uniref:Uncharacterized protein n=1 Tax=Xenoophorus captivus TaxID=1517983 RepID=A0ABV0QX56_9TELE
MISLRGELASMSNPLKLSFCLYNDGNEKKIISQTLSLLAGRTLTSLRTLVLSFLLRNVLTNTKILLRFNKNMTSLFHGLYFARLHPTQPVMRPYPLQAFLALSLLSWYLFISRSHWG